MSDEPPETSSTPATIHRSITNEELAAAIVEVASIQADLVRRVDAALSDARGGALGLRVDPLRGFSGLPTALSRTFDSASLIGRVQALITWLLAHIPDAPQPPPKS